MLALSTAAIAFVVAVYSLPIASVALHEKLRQARATRKQAWLREQRGALESSRI
jgi:hypothetical protein